jgi:Zn ribbon nucleic-acid-binding protein
LLSLICVAPLWAQGDQPQLKLGLQRYFGYGGFRGDIQGTFRVTASGPADLNRVVFLLDGQPMGEVGEPPFQLQFETDAFAPGPHVMVAVGYTATGTELRSSEQHAVFLTAEEAGRATTSTILPLMGGIVGIMLLSYAITYFVSFRHKGSLPSAGAPRHYGISGGAVCPKCQRPFALHWWTPHVGFGKIERCPSCGKWSLLHAASASELAAAAAEREGASASEPLPASTSEETLRRELDDSRFENR